MEIQKYKARHTKTNKELIGYIAETREYLGEGTYGNGTNYVITVTEKSMPGGDYGVYRVSKDSIEAI